MRPILGQRRSEKIRKVAVESDDWMYRMLLDATRTVDSSVFDLLMIRKVYEAD